MTIDRRMAMLGAGGAMAAAGALAWRGFGGDGGVPFALSGADVEKGHQLRSGRFPEPTETQTVGVVIVGGGVAGLSAGWALTNSGFDDFRLIELESEAGGNARSESNTVSAYPLGAHYLPVANREARALIHMLEQLGMITGRDSTGAPVYDPFQLCADLQDRVYWQGRWHEGLVPSTGLSSQDVADISGFFAAMARYRDARGNDGRPAFATPIAYSSQDPAYTALDDRDFTGWIAEQGWRSPVLMAHVRYCCRDDYGCEPDHVSAWAGIHYFAGRRGWMAAGEGTADADQLLTWPEGNARLTRAMSRRFADRISTGRIAFRIVPGEDSGIIVDSFDVARGHSIRTLARCAILSLPHFVAARIAPGLVAPADGFSYSPWLVANVTVDRPPTGPGSALAWDNVPFVGDSLGYVVATHQTAGRSAGPTVLTWYMPLSGDAPADARRRLLTATGDEWRELVIADLLRSNPDLDGAIRHVALWRWGHAMIRPVPGFVTRTAPQARAATRPPVFLAHSDISGLSLFEEAHYRGVEAAEGAMHHLSHAHESMI